MGYKEYEKNKPMKPRERLEKYVLAGNRDEIPDSNPFKEVIEKCTKFSAEDRSELRDVAAALRSSWLID